MRVRLLGTAAGGGFPQWNCNCANCQGIRSGSIRASARTQSSVALSVDAQHWFLLNASPDIRTQLTTFSALAPPHGASRGTAIEAIFLSDADFDHTLGLFILREGSPLTIYATATVTAALTTGIHLAPALAHYRPAVWHQPANTMTSLTYSDGTASGLQYMAFPIAGTPPRYMAQPGAQRTASLAGNRVGYCFLDEKTNGRLLFLPCVATLDETIQSQLQQCDALLFDGTFWSEHEMQEMHAGTSPASEMGHMPISGPQGSLHILASLSIRYKIYTHINNTNPMLREDSAEYASVKQAGIEIGWDSLEITI